jgi:drug/metabolite transporter (DMT)-like permease
VDQTNLIGGIVALLSAVTWGSGDFAGGVLSRKHSQVQVLALSAFSAAVGLALAMLVRGEGWPQSASVLWSVVAGVSGAIGTALLYQGLAVGQTAVVAPTAAVVSVTLPMIVGTLTQGAPGFEKIAGMAAAVTGIWLSTRGAGGSSGTRGLGLAVLAGFGFGGYFLCIVQVEPGSVFAPLLIAKLTAFTFALLALIFLRKGIHPFSLKGMGLAALAGILDATGNLFFLLAARLMRLELAAMISSMAPAITVILAAIVSRQRASFSQKLGVGLCLLAIALIMI